MKIPLVELQYLLKKSCREDTAYKPDSWSATNPLFGHCAVIALIAEDFFGGKIKRGIFPKEWQKGFHSKFHYWNELEGGLIADFSQGQFPLEFPCADFVKGKLGVVVNKKRNEFLRHGNVQDRYKKLRHRLDSNLKSNPLFTEEKFQLCWELAFSGEAVCPKMRFACLVYDGDKLITQSANKNFCTEFGEERLCSFDGSSCIRIGMPSRTDATLGDCGHAPIWCIKQVFDLGYKPQDLKKLDFYEGGFWPDGSPWWRDEPSYTCTYCENMFAIFGLDKIYGAFGGAWHPLWTKDSLYSSTEYAKGLKKA